MLVEELILYLYRVDPDNFQANVNNYSFPYIELINQAKTGHTTSGKVLLNYYYNLKEEQKPIPEELEDYIDACQITALKTKDFEKSFNVKKHNQSGRDKNEKILRDVRIAYKVHCKIQAEYLFDKRCKGTHLNGMKLNKNSIYQKVANEFNNTDQIKKWGLLDNEQVGSIYRSFEEALDYTEKLKTEFQESFKQ